MNDYSQDHFVLITGGSCGIGKAIATECAKRKMNVLLVALHGPELEETAQYLSNNYSIKTDTLAINLLDHDAPERIFNWCRDKGYTIHILVNNAGLAGTIVFKDSPLDYLDDRIQLNIRAVVLLTRLFIPEMKKLHSAYILNVSSMSAFFPIAYKSVYSASKAFVLHFSKAIKEELRNTPIRVSAVCPNGVRTNKGTHVRIDRHNSFEKIFINTVDEVAESAVTKMLKGKLIIIPGMANRFLLFSTKLIPGSIKARFAAKLFSKELNAENNPEKKYS